MAFGFSFSEIRRDEEDPDRKEATKLERQSWGGTDTSVRTRVRKGKCLKSPGFLPSDCPDVPSNANDALDPRQSLKGKEEPGGETDVQVTPYCIVPGVATNPERACHRPLLLSGAFPAARSGLVRTCTRVEGPAEGAAGQGAEPRQRARAARSGQRTTGPRVRPPERKEENVNRSVGDP